jgi:hypothetical protein
VAYIIAEPCIGTEDTPCVKYQKVGGDPQQPIPQPYPIPQPAPEPAPEPAPPAPRSDSWRKAESSCTLGCILAAEGTPLTTTNHSRQPTYSERQLQARFCFFKNNCLEIGKHSGIEHSARRWCTSARRICRRLKQQQRL